MSETKNKLTARRLLEGGIKPTNRMLTLRGINVQRFRDGRIVEPWGAANTFEALLEIGRFRLPGDE